MAIPLSRLQSAASRYSATLSKSVEQAKLRQQRTAFLCHSHQDNELARGLQQLLLEHGCEVYLDWQDTAMPGIPDRSTAQRIKQKILELDMFIFLATPSSTTSRWCPWEIGYADHAKSHENIFIVPTSDTSGAWYGNEYLQLYRQITDAADNQLGVFDPGRTQGILVKSLR